MAMVMSKSDLGLAARYADLVPDAELRDRVFGMITDEHERTIRMYKAITGNENLFADNSGLERSVHNRFPYLEPLNHLQVELIRRYRSGDESDQVRRGIQLTMNGLATALPAGSAGLPGCRTHTQRCAPDRTGTAVDLQLDGRTAVVTGAGKGIGLAITRALVAEGVHVVAGSRTLSPELESLQSGGAVTFVGVDLASVEGSTRLLEVAAARGGVDILVNNVGAVTPRTSGFAAITDEEWAA
eukprot:gene25526-30645_t